MKKIYKSYNKFAIGSHELGPYALKMFPSMTTVNLKGTDYLIEQELLDEIEANKEIRKELELKVNNNFKKDYPLNMEEVFEINKSSKDWKKPELKNITNEVKRPDVLIIESFGGVPDIKIDELPSNFDKEKFKILYKNNK